MNFPILRVAAHRWHMLASYMNGPWWNATCTASQPFIAPASSSVILLNLYQKSVSKSLIASPESCRMYSAYTSTYLSYRWALSASLASSSGNRIYVIVSTSSICCMTCCCTRCRLSKSILKSLLVNSTNDLRYCD